MADYHTKPVKPNAKRKYKNTKSLFAKMNVSLKHKHTHKHARTHARMHAHMRARIP